MYFARFFAGSTPRITNKNIKQRTLPGFLTISRSINYVQGHADSIVSISDVDYLSLSHACKENESQTLLTYEHFADLSFGKDKSAVNYAYNFILISFHSSALGNHMKARLLDGGNCPTFSFTPVFSSLGI